MRIGIALFRGAQAHFNEPNYYIFFVSKVFTFLFQRHQQHPLHTLLFQKRHFCSGARDKHEILPHLKWKSISPVVGQAPQIVAKERVGENAKN